MNIETQLTLDYLDKHPLQREFAAAKVAAAGGVGEAADRLKGYFTEGLREDYGPSSLYARLLSEAFSRVDFGRIAVELEQDAATWRC